MALRTVKPGSDLSGSWERTQPLSVVSGYAAPNILATAKAGYAGGDSNSAAVQNEALVLPEVGNAVPREIEQVGSTTFLTYVDTPGTSFDITLTSTTIQAGDLIIIDTSTQEGTDPGAPNTPTDFTQRFSHYTTSPNQWIPRLTRFYKIAVGGEESDVINITHSTSTRLHAIARVFRNVDQTTPFPSTQAQTHFTGQVDPGSISSVPVGSWVLSTVASNIFPNGADDFDTATDGPSGYTLVGANNTEPRFFIEYYRKQLVAGSEEPGTYDDTFDNWTHVTDAIQPAVGSGGGDLTIHCVTAVSDNTGTPDISANPPEVAATNERQRLQQNETSGTVTLTFQGETTAAIAFDATAATVEAALEALSTIGSGNAPCSGGPWDENPIEVQFFGSLAATDVGMISSADDVTIDQTTRGTAGFSFTFEGNLNTPTTGSTYTPQVQHWSAVPSNYVAGDKVTVTSSNHFPLHTWSAALIVVQNNDTADRVGAVSAATIDSGAAARAGFASITSGVSGSKLLAILAKASETHYSGEVMNATPPVGLTSSVVAEADAMSLELFESAAVPAAAHSISDAVWSGNERFTTAVIELKPAVAAGSAGLAATVGDGSDDTWIDIAPAAGSMYEVLEADLSSLPTGNVLTGATITVRHESAQRNALRVELVGINADGSIVAGGEKQAGGYFPDPVGSVQTITAGQWTELADGTPLSDYSRIGIALFSTSRAPTLTEHKIYTAEIEVEYIEGGPVVSNVQGPATPGADLTWDYASDAGLQQTSSQVRIVKGFDQDPEDTYTTHYFNQFDGDASGGPIPASTYFSTPGEVELYDSAGNAGHGVRRPSAIAVVEEASATSGDNVLRITATNGSGADAGDVVSGGMKFLTSGVIYGQAEFRVRGSGATDETVNPVLIWWPKANQTLFPDSNNASGDEGEWPAGGELDLFENFDNRDDLDPPEIHIHRLKLGAVPPYDSSDDETLNFTFPGIVGTDWHKYVFTWGPGILSYNVDNGSEVTLTTDPAWIPDWEMEITFQLDAWANTALTDTPTFDLDYILVRRLVEQTAPESVLNPEEGDVVYDTGKVAGELTRSLTLDAAPLGSGNNTAAVRAWALLPSGIEVASPWAVDTFDITGNPATNPSQTTDPVFNAATGGVELSVSVPAAVSRAWVSRSIDAGVTWTLLDVFAVSPSSTAQLIDYSAPLGQAAIRYQVVFDAGAGTESTSAQTIGSDVATTISDEGWYFIVPSDPTLNGRFVVAATSVSRPFSSVSVKQPGGGAVAVSSPLPRDLVTGVRTLSQAERVAFNAIVESGKPVRIVDVLGKEGNYQVAGDVAEQLLRIQPAQGETTTMRDAHLITVNWAEVAS